MRYLVTTLLLSIFALSAGFGQSAVISRAFNYPLQSGSKQDSILNGLSSIRGVYVHDDVDGDGKSEIVATVYSDRGHVVVFEELGDDSLQVVWVSPTFATGGAQASSTTHTPRYALLGDLDNDGKGEVIFQSYDNGIQIFEWDGVVGSDNYGTQPSQVIGVGSLSSLQQNLEYMETGDVDGDGKNELLVAYNGPSNADDRYYIFSGDGDWTTNDPGFSLIAVEYQEARASLVQGLNGGTPYAMIAADFSGTGTKDILVHNWNFKNVTLLKVTAADTYALIDTMGGTGNLFLSGSGIDDVALFGGFAFDVDKDGREEVYLPTYPAGNSPYGGTAHMIAYDSDQPTTKIDSSNVTLLSFRSLIGGKSVFGYGYGDIDADGKPNVYFTTTYPHTVFTAEFQGGDKRDSTNWTKDILYAGEDDIYETVSIRDSSGTVDTTLTRNTAFASKIFAKGTDFDHDGFEDIILPFQAINDSTTYVTRVWNGSQYDTTVNMKAANPKRWGLRIIEGTVINSVEAKDLTIVTPDDFRLGQNFPNPFNPSTTIPIYLPVRSRISVKIYDMLGKEIRTLINNEQYEAGQSLVTWDGKGNNGAQVSSGTYFYSLIHGNFQKTNKMVVLK
jgi:hypothetical protein